MDMTFLRRSLLLLPLFLAMACTNNVSDHILDAEPQLIMNALINANAPSQTLMLKLTGRGESQPLRQAATLTISVNGTLRHTLRPDTINYFPNGAIGFTFDADYRSGDVVRLDVRTDNGLYHAWAEVVVPQAAAVATDFQYQDVPNSGGGQPLTRYRFALQDDPTTRNYYRLTAGYLERWYDADSVLKESSTYDFYSKEDMALSDGLPTPRQADDSDAMGLTDNNNVTGIFDDSYFQNGRYTMTIYQDRRSSYYNPPTEGATAFAEINIDAISADHYHYLRGLNIYHSDNYTEEISQPVVFPSNIKGGTGIVAIFKRSTALFPLRF